MGRHCLVDKIVSYLGLDFPLFHGLDSVLNVKAVVAAFNQEKVLVGAFSVIVQLYRLIVYSTNGEAGLDWRLQWTLNL